MRQLLPLGTLAVMAALLLIPSWGLGDPPCEPAPCPAASCAPAPQRIVVEVPPPQVVIQQQSAPLVQRCGHWLCRPPQVIGIPTVPVTQSFAAPVAMQSFATTSFAAPVAQTFSFAAPAPALSFGASSFAAPAPALSFAAPAPALSLGASSFTAPMPALSLGASSFTAPMPALSFGAPAASGFSLSLTPSAPPASFSLNLPVGINAQGATNTGNTPGAQGAASAQGFTDQDRRLDAALGKITASLKKLSEIAADHHEVLENHEDRLRKIDLFLTESVKAGQPLAPLAARLEKIRTTGKAE